jgi:hypothetical protein
MAVWAVDMKGKEKLWAICRYFIQRRCRLLDCIASVLEEWQNEFGTLM